MGTNEERHRRQVQASLAYIERHLSQPIGLPQVSKAGLFSKQHFYRLFYRLVGHTVAEYVRNRRLTKAAADLAHTNERILDIAFNYHFQSQEAFTRAFKKVFQLTPGQYRSYSRSLAKTKGEPTKMDQRQVPQGWMVTGQQVEGYSVSVDAKEAHMGTASVLLQANGKQTSGFVTLMQLFSAEAYAGKRLKLTAFAKAEGVESGWAGIWMRVDNRNGDSLKFDNMQDRPIRGTADWNQYAVVLDVPENSHAIAFGVLLSGSGKVWADNFAFVEVDEKTPTTDSSNQESLPKAPVNLGFEAG
ncbi:helix-turn-helix domain-containing protein [Paenibacillus sp. NPDC058071]|uniref:helix-turn-helix domain-containing protein n=1 Tax=Paenibacillus sp. NPDC058071 TaxID=3346326 RepID=UPI0036DF1432